jgi:hypothetical protein
VHCFAHKNRLQAMLIGWNFAGNTDKMIEKSTHSNNTRTGSNLHGANLKPQKFSLPKFHCLMALLKRRFFAFASTTI